MTITSLYFLIFTVAAAALYYITPVKKQWMTLLFLSVVFYCLSAAPFTIIFVLLSTVTAYFSSMYISGGNPAVSGQDKNRSRVIALAVIFNVLLWFICKGSAYWIQPLSFLHARIPALPGVPSVSIPAALGMSYYTCQVIGYLLDCYWGTAKPQKNFFKLFLFLLFFPQLTTGPISRYNDLQTIYDGRPFDISKIERGAQRILWGFFKKLVLAERISLIVNTVDNNDRFSGVWLWAALLIYPMQLYSDFSGSVDIVLGLAEVFGIDLPENFNNPLMSTTSQEFWQRWHMTLGNWAKDYIMYPVLKNEKTLALSSLAKKKFGKRAGKLVSLGIGMFFTWLVMGIWHGNYKYILGCGIYYYIIMLSYEALSPVLKRINRFLNVNEQAFSWVLFKRIRTYFVLCVYMVFFRADGISGAFSMLKDLALSLHPSNFNLWSLFNGSFTETSLSLTDLNIIVISLLLLLLAALMREKCGHARDWISSQGLVFRWISWAGLFVLVIVFGKYGPGYHTADFIYQGF